MALFRAYGAAEVGGRRRRSGVTAPFGDAQAGCHEDALRSVRHQQNHARSGDLRCSYVLAVADNAVVLLDMLLDERERTRGGPPLPPQMKLSSSSASSNA